MAQKDEEYWYLKAVNAVKNNINTKITAINTEKNDGITLSLLNANAFFYYTFGNKIPNYLPAICFDSSTSAADTNGYVSSEELTIYIQLLTKSELSSDPTETAKRLLRYRRVLKDIIAAEFRDFRGLVINSMPDSPFQNNNLNYFTASLEVKCTLV